MALVMSDNHDQTNTTGLEIRTVAVLSIPLIHHHHFLHCNGHHGAVFGLELSRKSGRRGSECSCLLVEPLLFQLALFSQIAGKMVKLCLLEDADNEATLDILIDDCMEDYSDDNQSKMAQYAAKIARASITNQTRDKHIRCVSLEHLSLQILDNAQRIIKAFLTFHLKCGPRWDPKLITRQTPYDICLFITHKCGPKSEGYEG